MPILNALVTHSLEIWAVLFYLGLYALLLKPRWRHYGIAGLILTANILALPGTAQLLALAGIKPLANQYGFYILCLINAVILAIYCRRAALPYWKATMIPLVGGTLYFFLLAALALRTCHWFENACP